MKRTEVERWAQPPEVERLRKGQTQLIKQRSAGVTDSKSSDLV